MTAAGGPLLTIAIPMHRSRPFVDIISANLDAIGRDDVEILLSDRTAVDDAQRCVGRVNGERVRTTQPSAADTLDLRE